MLSVECQIISGTVHRQCEFLDEMTKVGHLNDFDDLLIQIPIRHNEDCPISEEVQKGESLIKMRHLHQCVKGEGWFINYLKFKPELLRSL